MVLEPAFGTFDSVDRQLCLTVFSSLRSSLLLVHILLPNFFLPVNFAFNMLWYSTLWTAPPFSNDPLWCNLFVEGVNDCLLDHCQVSSVPHYCGFKEQEIHRIYTVWMVIYWNSNVFLCGSVVEHCVSSAKGCGFDSQGTHILMKMYNLNVL